MSTKDTTTKKKAAGSPQQTTKDRMVKVTNVRKQPLSEGGKVILPGEEFEVTPARAKALGRFVNPPKEEAVDEGAE